MNQTTKDIMKLLKVGKTKAMEIQDHMGTLHGIDFSDCTKKEFNTAARLSQRELQERAEEGES